MIASLRKKLCQGNPNHNPKEIFAYLENSDSIHPYYAYLLTITLHPYYTRLYADSTNYIMNSKKYVFSNEMEFTTPLTSCTCGGSLKIDHRISAILYDILGIFEIVHKTKRCRTKKCGKVFGYNYTWLNKNKKTSNNKKNRGTYARASQGTNFDKFHHFTGPFS